MAEYDPLPPAPVPPRVTAEVIAYLQWRVECAQYGYANHSASYFRDIGRRKIEMEAAIKMMRHQQLEVRNAG